MLKVITLYFSFLLLIACSEKSSEAEPCGITVDVVSIIDTVKHGDATYYLVYRVSGWSDKTEILELYNVKPVFDHCSRSQVAPLYGDSLEMTQTIEHVYLNTKDKVLNIVYKNGAPDKGYNASLRLEIK